MGPVGYEEVPCRLTLRGSRVANCKIPGCEGGGGPLGTNGGRLEGGRDKVLGGRNVWIPPTVFHSEAAFASCALCILASVTGQQCPF